MNRALWAAALLSGTAAAGESNLQNYYDVAPATAQHAARPAPSSYTPTPRKQFIVDGAEGGHVPSPGNVGRAQPAATANGSTSTSQVALPPNMERGVKDLEVGMEDLHKYTGVMATHIQQNGLRGFLAIPPEIRDQGVAVGRKIGNGINGIATDTARDMIVPERQP